MSDCEQPFLHPHVRAAALATLQKCDNANTLPLFLAMEVRSGRITKMLLEAGADRSAHNADGIAAKDFVRNVSSEAVVRVFARSACLASPRSR